MANTIHIAEAGDETFGANVTLIAGDTPALVTRDVPISAAVSPLAQYVPLSFDSVGGAYKAWAAGEAVAGLTMYAVPDKAGEQRVAIATAGMFNIDAIAWPAATTEDQVLAATANSQMQFRKLLYSDKRNSTSGLLVGENYEAPAAG